MGGEPAVAPNLMAAGGVIIVLAVAVAFGYGEFEKRTKLSKLWESTTIKK